MFHSLESNSRRGLIRWSALTFRGSSLFLALHLLYPCVTLGTDTALENAVRGSDTLTSTINTYIVAPHLACQEPTEKAPIPSLNPSPLVEAARRIMVTQYQSCDALNAPVVDPNHVTLGMLEVVNPKNSNLVIRSVTDSTLYGASHPILSHLSGEVLPGCVDIRSAPPMYLYGSKFSLSYAGSTRTADLFVDQSRSPNCVRTNGSGYNGAACATEDSPGLSGIDCSGYLSLALMNAGYRFSVGSRADHYSTSQIVNSLRDRRTSCFEIAPLNQAPIVQPGSIYVMANKHAVMIDSTGPDPLGIERLPSGTPCDGLSAADFDFRIIHSSSRGSAAGITRMEASDYFVEAAEFAGPLVLMAQNACRVARGESVADPDADRESIATQKPIASVGDARLIRRPTPERRGCIGPASERVHLANESCTSSCDLSVEAPRL